MTDLPTLAFLTVALMAINPYELPAQNRRVIESKAFGASGVVSQGDKLMVVGDRDRNKLIEMSFSDLQLSSTPMDYATNEKNKRNFDTGLANTRTQLDSAFDKSIDQLKKELPNKLSFAETTDTSALLDEAIGKIKRDFIEASNRYEKELHQFEDIAVLDGSPVVICESVDGHATLLSPEGPIARYDFSKLTTANNCGLEGLDVVPIGNDGQKQVAILFEGWNANKRRFVSPRLFFHRLGSTPSSRPPKYELEKPPTDEEPPKSVRMSRSKIRDLAKEGWTPEIANRTIKLGQLQKKKKNLEAMLNGAAERRSREVDPTLVQTEIDVIQKKVDDQEKELEEIQTHVKKMLVERRRKRLRAPAVVMGRFRSADNSTANCAIVLVQDAKQFSAKWIVVITLDRTGHHEFKQVFSLRQLLGNEGVRPNWEGMCWQENHLVLVNDNTPTPNDPKDIRKRNLIVRLDLKGVLPPDEEFQLSDALQLESK
ncbi:hypothetical protein [Gimesia aquarii]|uniref:Uncharacterized protein n=1 Tax=Gimesia aquarii TaxID=2527964 RepID=A0A517W3P6_9PLAN|nr:hypothetical protein [Gimesia aquarii]QDT99876.1 hypothetical protein V144x_53900 [Gimesia aquarii]